MTKNTVVERNKKAKRYILDQLDLVGKLDENHFAELSKYDELSQTLKDLIEVRAKGFRGIVATALTGKFLDSSYDPLKNFYGCNPRSIFEKGVFWAFKERNIPCGQSDPLNVAKGENKLDDNWARGKRPESAAKAAIKYLEILEQSAKEQSEKIILFFFFRLLVYAQNIQSIPVEVPDSDKQSNLELSAKLTYFALECPESGAIPQLIIYLLFKYLYQSTETQVQGGDDSVFSTNTTSKKPADIWLDFRTGNSILYEITVKPVDQKRLNDCINSIAQLNCLNHELYFICRIPEDIGELQLSPESFLVHESNKVVGFIDIAFCT